MICDHRDKPVYSWLSNRICPVHQTQLEYVGKYQLGCRGKIGKGSKRVDCPHTEYISTLNPEHVHTKEPVSIVDSVKS